MGTVLRSLYRTFVMKRELSQKAKIQEDRKIQGSEIGFFERVAGISLRDKDEKCSHQWGTGSTAAAPLH